MLWKGYFEAYFDSSVDRATLNPLMLYVGGCLCLACVALSIITLIFFRTTDEAKADRDRIFNAPLVPILPSIGIVLNVILMAQISWINLAYLGIFLAVGIAAYLLYGVSHSMRVHDYDEVCYVERLLTLHISMRCCPCVNVYIEQHWTIDHVFICICRRRITSHPNAASRPALAAARLPATRLSWPTPLPASREARMRTRTTLPCLRSSLTRRAKPCYCCGHHYLF